MWPQRQCTLFVLAKATSLLIMEDHGRWDWISLESHEGMLVNPVATMMIPEVNKSTCKVIHYEPHSAVLLKD